MALALLVRTSFRVESQRNKGEIEKEKMRVKGVGKTQVQMSIGPDGAWGMLTEGCWA